MINEVHHPKAYPHSQPLRPPGRQMVATAAGGCHSSRWFPRQQVVPTERTPSGVCDSIVTRVSPTREIRAAFWLQLKALIGEMKGDHT